MESLIFTQRRVGKEGKDFQIYKIRTMYSGSEKHGSVPENGHKNAEDSRIIPERKWLRKTGFDEVP